MVWYLTSSVLGHVFTAIFLIWLDDFITLGTIYGGQEVNGQTLHYFNPQMSFWSCIEPISKQSYYGDASLKGLTGQLNYFVYSFSFIIFSLHVFVYMSIYLTQTIIRSVPHVFLFLYFLYFLPPCLHLFFCLFLFLTFRYTLLTLYSWYIINSLYLFFYWYYRIRKNEWREEEGGMRKGTKEK